MNTPDPDQKPEVSSAPQPAIYLGRWACLLILCAFDRMECSGADPEESAADWHAPGGPQPGAAGWITPENLTEFARQPEQAPHSFDGLVDEIQDNPAALALPACPEDGAKAVRLRCHWFRAYLQADPEEPERFAWRFSPEVWQHRARLSAALQARVAELNEPF